MEPIHPIARKVFETAKAWAAELSNSPFQFFVVGSLFRVDFDPQRSDLDLVAVVDDAVLRATPSGAVASLLHLRVSLNELDAALAAHTTPKPPISTSAYYTREIRANIHRFRDPDYYASTTFVALRHHEPALDPRLLVAPCSVGHLHPTIEKAIAYTQDVRHHFLAGGTSWVKKDWEKFFHNLRNLLRVSHLTRSDSVADKRTVLDIAAKYFQTNTLPLAELYQSLGPHYDPRSFPPSALLESFEILSQIAWQTASRSLRTWTFPETQHFVSDALGQELVEAKRQDVLAIDNGLCLYVPPGWDALPNELVIKREAVSPCNELQDPNTETLMRFGLERFDHDVSAYLRERAQSPTKGTFRTKMGISGIVFPNPRIQQLLTLTVYPLSFWTELEFNRRILSEPDNERLQYLRRKMLLQILRSSDAIHIPCPSSLFVEFCIITADHKIAVAEKSTTLSHLARRGSRWTATLEEGLLWGEYEQAESIDLQAAAVRALRLELDVPADAVTATRFFGIGLECTHLNCAIIGEVVLSLKAEELGELLRRSPDFGRNYHFIDMDRAFAEIFVGMDPPPSEWHPLGRMRCLLSLYQRVPREIAWKSASR